MLGSGNQRRRQVIDCQSQKVIQVDAAGYPEMCWYVVGPSHVAQVC